MKRICMALLAVSAVALAGCQSAPSTGAHFPFSAAKVHAATQTQPSLDIQRWTTAAGSQVLFVANPSLPMLDVQLTFAAGASRDAGVAGLAALTSNLIGEDAAGGLTSDAIARGFERRGANFNTGSYRDMAIIHLRSLTDSDYLDPSLKLFTQVLKPTFTAADIKRIRTQMLQGLRMNKSVPGPITSKTYMRTIFGEHPYAHPSQGTLQSLPAITHTQLADFYQRYYAAGNAVIALVGDISSEQAHQLAKRISAALPQGAHATALPLAAPQTAPHIKHVPFDSAQTHILIGNQAIHRGIADWPALYVGNWILGGGGFAARLMQQVRQQHGYVYGITSSLTPMAAGGPFTISLQTANDSAQKALDLTLKVTRQFIHDGPTQQEVDKAIDHITGSFPLSLASNSSIVAQLGAIGFYQLPSDYLTTFVDAIRQLTPAKVKAAMQRHIDPANFTIVDTGPKALTRPGVSHKTSHAGTTEKTKNHEHQQE